MIREIVQLSLTRHLLHKATLPNRESEYIYLIHRNKYRKADKLGRQRNMLQMKEQKKSTVKKLNKMDKQSTRYRVQNNGYKDYQGMY